MNAFSQLPELQAFDTRRQLIRIPHELDVPLTKRVQRIIDAPEFRRLARVSQLGLVSLVYPAAHHTRFEHSLGVFRNAILYLRQLQHDPRFTAVVSPEDAELFLVAALLHDIGHWPFCHPIEDMKLPEISNHESGAAAFLTQGEVADALRTDWKIDPAAVVAFLSQPQTTTGRRVLKSLLSGPIDIDKMDYLPRDSLHAGVPYGRNFDQQRLIGSLCLNEAGDGLAITEKGRTAAEMMVFARYVMFSEVYWHHTVRSATAMLQRAVYLLRDQPDVAAQLWATEAECIARWNALPANTPSAELLSGIFGPTRRLYKYVGEYSYFQERELYEQIARRPFAWLVRCSERFAEILTKHTRGAVAPNQVLVDAPPVKREVEFRVAVHFPKESMYRMLGDISPAVHALATRQFDDYVKRVRVFVHPAVFDAVRSAGSSLPDLVRQAAAETDSTS